MAVDHYENFPVASVLLPERLRRPVKLIYSFARQADDFADEGDAPPDQRLHKLAEFSRELDRIERGEPPRLPLFAELAPVITAHRLPVGLFRDLLSAFTQDVTKSRYADFREVMDYCRRSANPVGRLLLHLYRAIEERNLACSDAICSSLQLINFLQDVEIDFRKNRVYLPQDEMTEYGVSEGQIANRAGGAAWQALMTFQIERARSMLLAGAPLARRLPGRVGLELRVIVMGGSRILDKLRASRGDVFRHRPVLQPYDWLAILFRSLFAYP